MSTPRKPQLTEGQRELVELARTMTDAEAGEISGLDESDRRAYVIALGRVQGRMASLVALIDDLTGGTQ
jgi:hypothetical protein